ncbi:stalk domain-containing protein [Paenibacillus oryzisoli]|uniref:Copper amine oxidase-like N-terminal domain-containing protein n=1 Tax=Paenibacillus oryzisoli TaxID=1850517 RepID=A0A198AE70_9BACL|nr:stalk domain-containing protein [Paenibacillus oryzisoli]OAS19243.1 hypothetical protein A8708_26390 [Paenibacillus oryzisoli]
MKKFIIGLLVGVAITVAGSVYADEGLEKIEAYLRPSLPVTLNGEVLKLDSSPVMVDGSTYLKLRDVATVTGLTVNWNDATQTVELSNKGVSKVSELSTTTENLESLKNQRIDLDKRINELSKIIEPYGVVGTYDGKLGFKEKDETFFTAKASYDELSTQRNQIDAQITALEAQK